MSTLIEERWPWLSWLAQGYFDEDWPDEHNNAAEVVEDFLVEGAQFGEALATEIREVLDFYSEADLPHLFGELDLLVDPTLDLNTYRGWLAGVYSRVTPDSPRPAPRSRLPAESAVNAYRHLSQRWPVLHQFGSGYFTPGWQRENYWSTRLVLDAFRTERPDLAAALPGEIGEVLAEYREEELGAVLDALEIDYDPTAALNTNRGWLTEVARRVRQPLGELD